MVLVKYIASRKNPALWESTMTSMQRAAEAALEQSLRGSELDASKGPLGHGQFEEIAIQMLSSYSMCYDLKKDMSCPNGYGQTLAHLAVTLGYIRLLEQLISWEIDLSVRDTTGATALHFAYLYDQPKCVSLLTRSGANQQIRGELGREPYAMTWPNDSGASLNGTLDDSSDSTSEHVTSITDREEMPGKVRVSGQKWSTENNRFDQRQANLMECVTNSVQSVDVDPNHRSPARHPTETSTVEVQPRRVSTQGRGIVLRTQATFLMLVSMQDPQTANRLSYQRALPILRRAIAIHVRLRVLSRLLGNLVHSTPRFQHREVVLLPPGHHYIFKMKCLQVPKSRIRVWGWWHRALLAKSTSFRAVALEAWTLVVLYSLVESRLKAPIRFRR